MESSAAYSASNYAVVPLVFRMSNEDGLAVKAVGFFRDECFSHENEDHHDSDLEESLTDDMLHH